MKLPGISSRKVEPAAYAAGEASEVAAPQGGRRPWLPNLLLRQRSSSGAEPRQNEAPRGSCLSTAEGITREDFEVLSLLGRGGFGEVKLVRCALDRQLYAMKALEKTAIHDRRHVGDTGARGRVQAERDIGVMANQWKCPFIIELFATFQTRDKVYFIFDYCPQGDLFERLQEQSDGRFEESAARFYVAEVTLALEHLHAHDAVHRDVKLENMLLSSDGHIKLADFGIAKMSFAPQGARPSYAFGEGSSTAFYPPEFREGEAYGKDLDCWQLGVAAFLMLVGQLPEPGGGACVPRASAAAGDFCGELLAPCRERRLGYPSGAGQLREHSFLQPLDWHLLEECRLPPPGSCAAVEAPGAPQASEGVRPLRPKATMFFRGQKSGLFRLPRFTFVSSVFRRFSSHASP